jgi:hypothetical protein
MANMENEPTRTGKRLEGVAVEDMEGEQVVGDPAVGGEWWRVAWEPEEVEAELAEKGGLAEV